MMQISQFTAYQRSFIAIRSGDNGQMHYVQKQVWMIQALPRLPLLEVDGDEYSIICHKMKDMF